MKITYFTATDTALLEFASKPVAETREISEDSYVDLDAEGRFVSMTIEHAKTSASINLKTTDELNHKGTESTKKGS